MIIRSTLWDGYGSIVRPWELDLNFPGATDQTEPTMPAWMKDDAKWQAALDAQE